MYSKKIVITGIGVISPLGDTPMDFYNNLIAGKSGIKKMTSIDTSRIRCKIGGDLGDYDVKEKLDLIKNKIPDEVYKRARKIIKTAPFSTKMTLLTALYAYIDSGLIGNDGVDPKTIATIIGGHNFHDNYIVKNVTQFLKEPEFIDGLMGICVFDSDVAASICETLQLLGPMYTTGGTCTSSGIAIKMDN